MVSGRLVVGRGNDGPGAGIHQQVQHQEGTDDLLPPQSVIVHALHQVLPEAGGLGQLAGGMAPLEAGREAVAIGQNEGGGLALRQGEGGRHATVAEGKGNAGEKGHCLASAAGLDGRAAGVAAQRAEVGNGAGVVVPGLEVAAQLHFAGMAGDDPVNFVGRVRRRRVRVAVIVAGQRHEVGDGYFAIRAGEGGLEDVGVRQVLLTRLEAG